MGNITQIEILPPPETKLIHVMEGRAGPAGPAGASSSVLQYKADANNTTPNDPGAGKMRWDNATQTLSTNLYIDRLTDTGFDATGVLINTEIHDEFIIQDLDLAVKTQTWRKTGPGVLIGGDWFTVPVEFVSSTGSAEFSHNQRLAVIIKSVGTVGPQGPQGEPGPPGPAGSSGAEFFFALNTNIGVSAQELVTIWEFPVETGKTYVGRGAMIVSNVGGAHINDGGKVVLTPVLATMSLVRVVSTLMTPNGGQAVIGPSSNVSNGVIFDVINTAPNSINLGFIVVVSQPGTIQIQAGPNAWTTGGLYMIQGGSWVEINSYNTA